MLTSNMTFSESSDSPARASIVTNSPVSRRQFLAATSVVLAWTAGAAEVEARLRVGVIGHTGRGNYGHFLDTMWLRLPETKIVAVADADPAGLAAAQKKLKVSSGFADYRKMLAETRPDIVAVCPRSIDQHSDMALAAIEGGVRGLYVEKPFCRTPAEADQIIAACERRGVTCAVAHRNRYHPALPVIQQMLKDGAIGRLLEIRGRGKEDERGGPEDFWVLGSHVLNLAQYFAGRPRACSGVLLQQRRPATRANVKEGRDGVGPVAGDELHARFETESGVPVFFDSVARAGNREAGFGMQLVGTQGLIDLRLDQDPIAHLLAGSPFLPSTEPRIWVPVTSAGHGRPELIANLPNQVRDHILAGRDLLAAMREKRPPLCSADDARTVVEMICAVFESHRLDGKRVSWPLKTRLNPLALL
jgi:predicted dehydrogenase